MCEIIYKIGAVIYNDPPNCKVRKHDFTKVESYDTTPLIVRAYDNWTGIITRPVQMLPKSVCTTSGEVE